MLEIVAFVLAAAVNIALSWAIVRADRARLRPEQADRAWNAATFACAIVFFGPLSLPAHFWVTRRRPVALLVGVGFAAAVIAVDVALGAALETVAAWFARPGGRG